MTDDHSPPITIKSPRPSPSKSDFQDVFNESESEESDTFGINPSDTNEMLESWAYFNADGATKSKSKNTASNTFHSSPSGQNNNFFVQERERERNQVHHHHQKGKFQKTPHASKSKSKRTPVSPTKHKYTVKPASKFMSPKTNAKHRIGVIPKPISPTSSKIDYLFSIFSPKQKQKQKQKQKHSTSRVGSKASPQTLQRTHISFPSEKFSLKDVNMDASNSAISGSGVKLTLTDTPVPVPFLSTKNISDTSIGGETSPISPFTPPLQAPVISKNPIPLADVGGKTITFKTKKKRGPKTKPKCILCGFPGHLRQRCPYRQIADYYTRNPFQVTDFVEYDV